MKQNIWSILFCNLLLRRMEWRIVVKMVRILNIFYISTVKFITRGWCNVCSLYSFQIINSFHICSSVGSVDVNMNSSYDAHFLPMQAPQVTLEVPSDNESSRHHSQVSIPGKLFSRESDFTITNHCHSFFCTSVCHKEMTFKKFYLSSDFATFKPFSLFEEWKGSDS